jgi:GNAT superfamily N-acetyltransferase
MRCPPHPLAVSARISDAGIADAAELSVLFDACLGVIEGREADLAARLSGSLRALIARDTAGGLLGAATWSVCGDAASREKLDNHPLLCAALDGLPERLGWLEVEPEARHQGIGRMLLDERLERMRAAGARDVLALAWTPPGRWADSEHLLRGAGLAAVVSVEAFWAREGARDDYCPYCGSDCRCAAVLFWGSLV